VRASKTCALSACRVFWIRQHTGERARWSSRSSGRCPGPGRSRSAPRAARPRRLPAFRVGTAGRPARLRRRSRPVELWTLARLAFHPWDAPRRRWRAVDDKDVRRRCRPGRSDRPVLAAAWRFELREALAGAAPPVETATHWRRLTALLPGCRPPRRYWFPTSRLASFHRTRRAISGAAFTNISPPWAHLTVRANLSWGTASGPEWASTGPNCLHPMRGWLRPVPIQLRPR
jgi:hypothetical protein